MDRIQRNNQQLRGDRVVIYPFTTYSIIFKELNQPLYSFLKEMFIADLPKDRKSVSSAPQLRVIGIKDNARGEELMSMCRAADYHGARNKQHDVVQQYFLDNDPHTIAVECPVFDDELLGHIDILRTLPDRIQILDFKPNAHKETKAASQIHRYRQLLRKKLPGVKIEAAYFDENNIYFLI